MTILISDLKWDKMVTTQTNRIKCRYLVYKYQLELELLFEGRLCSKTTQMGATFEEKSLLPLGSKLFSSRVAPHLHRKALSMAENIFRTR